MFNSSQFEHLKARRFVSFALVGGLATSVHWAITALLVVFFSVPAIAASTVGFVFSAAFNFLANAQFTFGVSGFGRVQALRFGIVAASGCVWNALALETGLRLGLPIVVAQVSATLMVLVWNFALNAIWVFKPSGSA